MAYLLGIDIGTSGTKALLCDEAGAVLGLGSAPHDLSSPKPGWSEQDPEQWWSASGKAVKQALKKAGVAKSDVSAIGLSGQMHGAVFLDRQDRVLRPAILWNDQRTGEECQAIEDAVGGRRKLIPKVGNPALTGFTAPKALWLRTHEPRNYDRCRSLLLPKDYLRLRMTGEKHTDVGDASGTLLLDVRKRAWSRPVIEAIELDAGWLPPVLESHEIAGKLTPSAAKALGLTPGVPVAAGSGDQPACAVGVGVVQRGAVSATLGTSGVVFAHSDEPAFDPHGRVHTMCSAVEGKWCVFGCMLSAAGSFQWFRECLADADAKLAKRQKRDIFDVLVEEAEATSPGADGLAFLPHLTGERCPHPDPGARGAWIGLARRHTRGHLVRALLEGVTLTMGQTLSILTDDMDVPAKKVLLSGGGAQSAFWRQLQADVYGKPCATVQTDQGPAYGAALLAGVGAGVWKNVPEACRAVVRESQTLKPNAKQRRFYQHVRERFTMLYPALRGYFDAVAHG
ncbi:MAG: xylulokinase [Planctomycetota bacterium]